MTNIGFKFLPKTSFDEGVLLCSVVIAIASQVGAYALR